MPEAVRIIRAEHRGLDTIVSTLELLRRDLAKSDRRPDTVLFRTIFQYIESYTNRYHHPKEDEYLFKALRQRAPESHAIVDELQQEHRDEHSAMAGIVRLLGEFDENFPKGRTAFVEALGHYIRTAREHCRKEEEIVLPMAERHLTDADWKILDAAFRENTDPLFGPTLQEEFRELHSRIVNILPAPMGLGLRHQEEPPAIGARRSEVPVLEITGLTSHYGRIQALKGIDLRIYEGELVALVGANGAGKTTLLLTVSGVQPASGGKVHFDGRDITRISAHKRTHMGISQVPEGRQVFGPMPVEANLRLGAFGRRKADMEESLDRMYEMFPILRQKRREPAGTLSGGQQQMLAMARALMREPRLLLLDEPSMGLAPLLVEEILTAVTELRSQGMTIFLVEQNAHAALSIADRGYVIETGNIVLSDAGQALLENEQVKQAYLGI